MSSEPSTTPAWPFLVANHERGRVDYRTIVAPDFLGEQGVSQVLAGLPLELETEEVACCRLTYQTARGKRCEVTAVFQAKTIVGEQYFPVRPQRSVQVLVGAIFSQPLTEAMPSQALLSECFALYEDSYREFCQTSAPTHFPVVLSWPLTAALTEPPPPTALPPLDGTRLHGAPLPTRSAPVVASLRAERAYPISRATILQQIQRRNPSLWARLRGYFSR